MLKSSLAALTDTLTRHIELSKSRVATLGMLIVGMVGARTVNLSHIASERGSHVKIASTYRRFQRFFQHVDAVGCGACWMDPAIPPHPTASP